MFKQLQKRNVGQDGFTIIEVMIVLAIAGLIMVVVFLAVPALQRSSRNNALSTDANNILTAVGNYSSDNGGSLPTAVAWTSGNPVTIGANGSNTESAKVDTGVSKVSLNGATITNGSAVGTVQVVTGTGAVCNAGDTGLTGTNTGSPRSYAVLYIAEGGSGNIVKCVGD